MSVAQRHPAFPHLRRMRVSKIKAKNDGEGKKGQAPTNPSKNQRELAKNRGIIHC